jgi:putative endonuclease
MELRLAHHNSGHNRSTKAGAPWKIIKVYHVVDRTEALRLENKIKKRGAKRFLSDEGLAG